MFGELPHEQATFTELEIKDMTIDEAAHARRGGPASPEQRLWLAIIVLAWEDAADPDNDNHTDARRFLMEEGKWGQWRREVCQIAGVGSHRLRMRAMSMLGSGMVAA